MEAQIEVIFREAISELAAGGTSLQVSEAWDIAQTYINPHLLSLPLAPPDERITRAFGRLQDARLKDDLLHWYFDEVSKLFGPVSQTAHDSILSWESDSNLDRIYTMIQATYDWVRRYQHPLSVFGSEQCPEQHQYLNLMQTLLFAKFPQSFTVALRAIFVNMLNTPSTHVVDQLAYLGILERFLPVLFSLVYDHIEEHVNAVCRGVWDIEDAPRSLSQWLNTVVGTVMTIFQRSVQSNNIDQVTHTLKPAFSRFEYHIQKTLCELRASELFDIIVDYPASIPALNDLKACLLKTEMRETIISSLMSQNSKRLLHPGAETKDIITQYISTIKSMRILDSQGVLLSRVTEPVRTYLRSRADTIRCIVSALIEEGSDLSKEVDGEDGIGKLDTGNDDAEDFLDPSWKPVPIDAPPNFRSSKGSDILQMLVSIYDSKDLFVKELQILLAQRLLAVRDYDLDREIRNIEILKIRFGEISLQSCEVMLKDLMDSKRIDTSIHNQDKENPMRATIVSRLFWPPFQKSSFELGSQFKEFQKRYSDSYKRNKPERYLVWMPHLGSVNMKIELQDRIIDVEATPLQASVLEQFSQKDRWTIEELKENLKAEDFAQVRNALYFWANNGAVREGAGNEWRLLEVVTDDVHARETHVIEDSAPAVASVQEHQIEQMRVLWAFIKGMLTNLGASPAERVHTMLSKFVPDYKGRTIEELVAFLEAMQREGALEKVGANWKLV